MYTGSVLFVHRCKYRCTKGTRRRWGCPQARWLRSRARQASHRAAARRLGAQPPTGRLLARRGLLSPCGLASPPVGAPSGPSEFSAARRRRWRGRRRSLPGGRQGGLRPQARTQGQPPAGRLLGRSMTKPAVLQWPVPRMGYAPENRHGPLYTDTIFHKGKILKRRPGISPQRGKPGRRLRVLHVRYGPRRLFLRQRAHRVHDE